MICPSCGTSNESGRKFCKACAARLSLVCPSCGAANAPDSRFCGECATRLTDAGTPAASPGAQGAPAAPAASRPIAERRLVSVLFADLVGFTTLAEGRDAEDTRELLTRYFELARDVIGRHGGLVEKFIGDAVMAVWGTPQAHEDDAERAVRAALELVDVVGAIGPGIRARAGVLTGEAAVTVGATDQGMIAGDLVNTASRFQSAAAPGSVLVGEATQRAASRAVAFEPVGELQLKGKAESVPAWRAIRVVAERRGRGRADVQEAPFVGRTDELRLLKDLFHATVREGRSRLVSVFGPGGIGKTRLAWEFLKYVDGLAEPVWWHDGRSPAYGDGVSFWALGEMVRGRCGLRETDDEATTRARVAETVAHHVPDPDERRWIEGALLALLGVERGADPQQLFAAWRTFFERLAASAPVVLSFEDFHFADPGLIDFVDHLLEWSRGLPIHVLVLTRPELLERRPDWGVGKRAFVSLHLDPLSDDEMRGLLSGLVPGLPDAAMGAIVARADGMPLYAVETVRMLLAQGRITVEDGVYRPVGALVELSVPETLTALIGSRLDTLSPADRALVSDAAVLGQTFSVAALAAVSGIPEATLEPRMPALVRRELVRLELDPRSPERGRYTFVQALIREVAYATLSRRDRTARHLAAARYLEALDSDELAGALAGHVLAAHAAAPSGPEADALAAQARSTLRAAADRATALGSPGQAVVFLDQALSITTEPAIRAELLEAIGATASMTGDFARSRVVLQEAVSLHEASGDRHAQCRATTELVRMLLQSSWREEGVAQALAVAGAFPDLAEDPVGVALAAQVARASFLAFRYAEAIAAADVVLATAERLDLEPIVADVLVTKGSALGASGRRREGAGVLDTGRRLAEGLGLTFTVLRATLNSIGGIQEDDPASAMVVLRRGIELSARLGQIAFLLPFLETYAYQAARTGDWEDALTRTAAGLELTPERHRVHLVGVQAWFAVLRGEPGEPYLERISGMLREDDDVQTTGHLWLLHAGIGLAHGSVAEVETAVRWNEEHAPDNPDTFGLSSLARVALWSGDAGRAADALERFRATPFRGRAYDATIAALTAGIAALEGRTEDAHAGYRTALRAFEALGLRFDGALVGVDMAQLLDPADPEVAAAAASARELFTRVGGVTFVARLDRAMERGAVPS